MMMMYEEKKKKGYGGIVGLPKVPSQEGGEDMAEDAIESALYAFKAAMAEGDMKVAKRAFKTAVSMCCMAEYADDYNDKKG